MSYNISFSNRCSKCCMGIDQARLDERAANERRNQAAPLIRASEELQDVRQHLVNREERRLQEVALQMEELREIKEQLRRRDHIYAEVRRSNQGQPGQDVGGAEGGAEGRVERGSRASIATPSTSI